MGLLDSLGIGGAGPGIIGGLISGAASLLGQSQTNSANQELLQEQEAYNTQQTKQAQGFDQAMMLQAEAYDTQMSNSAYQRGVKDLEAAGLNPMLAYSQGGDSAPTISAPSSPAIPAPSSMSRVSPISGAVSAGLNAAQAVADLDNKKDQGQMLRDQAELAAAQQRNTDETTRSSQTNADRLQWERDNIWPLDKRRAEADTTTAETAAKAAQYGLQGAKNESDFQRSVSDAPQWLKLLEGIMNSGHTGLSLWNRLPK